MRRLPSYRPAGSASPRWRTFRKLSRPRATAILAAVAVILSAPAGGVVVPGVGAQESGMIPGYEVYGQVEMRGVAAYAKDSPVVADRRDRGTWSTTALSRIAATHRLFPGRDGAGDSDRLLRETDSAELVIDHAIIVLPGYAVDEAGYPSGLTAPASGTTGTAGTGAATATGVVLSHELYQGYVSLHPGDRLAVRLGRQRLNWGTGWTWSVSDALHPQSADSEVEPGFDGGSVSLLVSPNLSIELALAGQDAFATSDPEDLRTAGYISAYLPPVDIALSVVHQRETTLRPGIGVSLPVGPVLLAGEAAVEAYDPRGRELNAQNLASLGGEYAWYGDVADLVLMAEYIHNGLADTFPDPLLSPANLTVTTDYAGGFQRPGRHYAAASATIAVVDSWSTEHQILANLSDESYLVRHSLGLQRIPGVDLDVAVTWTAGAVDSEFGFVPQGMVIEVGTTAHF
jgi:hypothetical protein